MNAAKNTKINLDQVKIASPCSEDWNKMSGDDRVRHCQKCRLNVYNISEMTRFEAEQLISSRIQDKRVCVRIFRRPDGTILTKDCPVGLRRARIAWVKVQSLRVAAVAFIFSLIGLGRLLITGKPLTMPKLVTPLFNDSSQSEAGGIRLAPRLMGDVEESQ